MYEHGRASKNRQLNAASPDPDRVDGHLFLAFDYFASMDKLYAMLHDIRF